MLKRILIIALSILILIGAGGCMKNEAEGYSKTQKQAVNKKKSYTNEEKKNMVLKYLKDKYDEEFEGIAYTPKQWGTGGDSFYVRPKNGTDEDGFEVWGIVNKKNGVYEFTDGYFGVYIRSEYEKVMRSFIDEFYSDYKMYIKTDTEGDLPQRLNKNTKIDEIYKKGEKYGFSADVYVFVKESLANGRDIKDVVKKIAVKKVENKLVGEICVCIIRDERFDFIKIDKENWQKASDEKNLVKSYYLDVDYYLKINNYSEV